MLTPIRNFNDFGNVTGAFSAIGGQFVLAPEKMKEKLADIKAFVFDWDGVFNNGFKSKTAPGLFAEPDAAGLNLLRYSYFLKTKTIPPCAIITGEDNPGAIHFSEREHFNAVYMKVLKKPDAVNHFCKLHDIPSSRVACVFDDMNDIAMAKSCGLRFMVKKSANPAFRAMAINNFWCDYITGTEQDNYSIREICELIMALNGSYEKSILSRVAFDDSYVAFLKNKKEILPALYKAEENGFTEVRN